MGLHNLESASLMDIFDRFSADAERSQAHGWLDSLMATYASNPVAPLSTQVELASYMLNGLRGLYFSFSRRAANKRAALLYAVIEQNKTQRLAIFIEHVECQDVDETMRTYTVWKGTLWETTIKGDLVVCWHPDKDYKPVDGAKIVRTGYSELGRRQRRRQTKPAT